MVGSTACKSKSMTSDELVLHIVDDDGLFTHLSTYLKPGWRACRRCCDLDLAWSKKNVAPDDIVHSWPEI